MSLHWMATYSDGRTVHSAACRWAELDRSRLAHFAVYAHPYDAAPILDVPVAKGQRVMQCVRNFQGPGTGLARVGIVARENADRTHATVWTLSEDGTVQRHEGYSPGLWEMAMADYEEAVRVI